MSKKRFPPNAVDVDVQVTDPRLRVRGRRNVLTVGELNLGLRADLAARGAILIEAPGLYDGFVLLAEYDFDVVVVNPLTDNCGLDFVNAIKEGSIDHQLTIATLYGARGKAKFLEGVKPPSPDQLEAARDRHRLTPFVVLPLSGENEYSVIVMPPQASLMKHAPTQPIASTILTVDAKQVMKVAPPLC